MIFDIKDEVHHATLNITKITQLKTDIVLHLEIALLMTKVPLLHTIFAHDMITIKEILDVIDLRIYIHIDLHKDMTLVIDINLVLILEIKTLLDILLHSDHHRQDQEILDTPDLDHTPTHESNLTQFNYHFQKILSTLKNACTLLLKS